MVLLASANSKVKPETFVIIDAKLATFVLMATVESISNRPSTEFQSIPVPASADWSTSELSIFVSKAFK